MKKKFFVRMIACVIAAVMLLSSAMVFAADAKYMGDVNFDGRVNSTDARLILRHSARMETLKAAAQEVADINSDNRVNSSDARLALRMAAKMDDLIPVTEQGNNPTQKPNDPNIPSVPTTKPTTPTETTPEETVAGNQDNASVSGNRTDHTSYYMRSVITEYDASGRTKNLTTIEFAIQSMSAKYGVLKNKTKKYTNYYIRTGALSGNDMGMMILGEVTLTGNLNQDFYMIDYGTKTYLCLDHLFINTMGDMKDDLLNDLPPADPIPTYSSLDKLDAKEVKLSGVTYYMTENTDDAGNKTENYWYKADGTNYYYAAVIREYKNGILVSETRTTDFSPNPAPYFSLKGMSGKTVTTALGMLDPDVLEFMERMTGSSLS